MARPVTASGARVMSIALKQKINPKKLYLNGVLSEGRRLACNACCTRPKGGIPELLAHITNWYRVN